MNLLIVLATIIPFFFLAQSQTANNKEELQENNIKEYDISITGNSMTQKYFVFTPTRVPDNQSDLVIIVRPSDFQSDPDIFISSQPNFTVDNPQESCFHYGLDMCFIPHDKIVVGKPVYILVYSQRNHCKFSIEVRIEAEQQPLNMGQERLMVMRSNTDPGYTEEKVFKVFLPNDKTINHFTVAVNIVKDLNVQFQDHDIHLFVGIGNDPPDSRHMIWGNYRSQYGSLFTAFRGDANFIPGSNYTFILDAPQSSVIRTIARVDGGQPLPITFEKRTIFDAIPIGRNITYVINTENSMTRDPLTKKIKESLVVNLLTHQGDPDLYVNCDSVPPTLEGYKWQSQGRGFQTLVISAHQFQGLQTECQNIYITVYAQVCAAFSLQIISRLEDYQGQTVLPISPGISETSFIKTDEIVSYMLILDKKKPENVTVSLIASHGNPDLFVQKCQSQICTAQRSQIDGIIHNQNFIGISNEIGNDRITFQHSELMCPGSDNSISCVYLISVYVNGTYNNLSQDIRFMLTLSLDTKPIYLKEGIPIKDSVRVGQYQYYVFNLYQFKEITSIFFQVTPISGDPDLFISRSSPTPGFGNFEKAACFCVNLIQYVSYELGQKENNTFYISTYGLTNSDYTINIIIQRNQTDETSSETSLFKSVTLFNHIPQKSVFRDNQTLAFFDINLVTLDQKKKIIELHVDSIKGSFEVYATPLTNQNKTSFPKTDLRTKYRWFSSNQNLLLSFSGFASNETIEDFFGYRILVVKMTNLTQSQFIISYSNEDIINELMPNRPQSVTISTKKTMWFQLQLEKTDDTIMILHTSEEKGVALFVSSTAGEFDTMVGTWDTQYFTDNTVEISNAFQNHCTDPQSGKQIQDPCYLFGTLRLTEAALESYVKAKKDVEIQSSLLMVQLTENNVANYIKASDGDALQIPVYQDKNQTNTNLGIYYQYRFYSRPINQSEPFIISCYSYMSRIVIKSEVIRVQYTKQTEGANGSPTNWTWPSSLSQQQKSYLQLPNDREFFETFKEKTIMPNEYKHCLDQDCVVLYTVFIRNLDPKEIGLMILFVSSEITDISMMDGKEVYGSVGFEGYRYFKVHLNQNENIFTVKLSILSDADANIVVSHNRQSNFRPQWVGTGCSDMKNCQYSTLPSKYTDMIQFSPAPSGDYVIGVFGTEGLKADFKLQWTVSGMYSVKTGVLNRVAFDDQLTFVYSPVLKSANGTYNIRFESKIPSLDQLNVYISFCQEKLLSHCPVPTSTTNDYAFNPSINANEFFDNGKCAHGCYLIGSMQYHFGLSMFQFILTQQGIEMRNMTLLPNIFFEDTIGFSEVQLYNIHFNKDSFKDDIIFTLSPYIGDTQLSIEPSELRTFTKYENQRTWIRISKKKLELSGINIQNGLTITILAHTCTLQQCKFGIASIKRSEIFELTPGRFFVDYLDFYENQRFNAFVAETQQEQIQQNSYCVLSVEQKDIPLLFYDSMRVTVDNQNRELGRSYLYNILHSYNTFHVPLFPGMNNITLQYTPNDWRDMEPINYSLMMQTGGIIRMQLDEDWQRDNQTQQLDLNRVRSYSSQQAISDDPDLVVVETQSAGTVILQLQQCTGTTELKIASSMSNLKQKNFDVSIFGLTPDQSLAVIDIANNGQYYFQLNLTDTILSSKEGAYMLSAFFTKQRKIKPFDLLPNKLFAGDDGQITFKYYYDSNNELVLRLKFQPIQINDDNFTLNTEHEQQFDYIVTLSKYNISYQNDIQLCRFNGYVDHLSTGNYFDYDVVYIPVKVFENNLQEVIFQYQASEIVYENDMKENKEVFFTISAFIRPGAIPEYMNSYPWPIWVHYRTFSFLANEYTSNDEPESGLSSFWSNQIICKFKTQNLFLKVAFIIVSILVVVFLGIYFFRRMWIMKKQYSQVQKSINIQYMSEDL